MKDTNVLQSPKLYEGSLNLITVNNKHNCILCLRNRLFMSYI